MAERRCRPTAHEFSAIREESIPEEAAYLYCLKCGEYRIETLVRAKVPDVFHEGTSK